ncbi:MAG: glutathione transferase GstA [Gammaproteobacteria bacterium]
MKLYYSPGACSLAAHIALRESGVTFELEKVGLEQHKTASGGDYYRINPKGYVPALKLDDGGVLSEAGVVLQYIADKKPESGLAPKPGTMERYRLMEWLTFISSEIHKTFTPFFYPEAGSKDAAKAQLAKRFDYVEKQLAEKPWLMGDTFTVADAYLFVVTNWTNIHEIDLSKWPKLKDFMARVQARQKVQEAMKAEGLIESR